MLLQYGTMLVTLLSLHLFFYFIFIYYCSKMDKENRTSAKAANKLKEIRARKWEAVSKDLSDWGVPVKNCQRYISDYGQFSSIIIDK